jgi:LysM repeat protein
MIRPSKMKRSAPWFAAAAFLLVVGGIVYTLRNQETPATFTHIPEADIVESQKPLEIPAPEPPSIPEGVRMAADPETVGPILSPTDEREEEIVEEQTSVVEEEESEQHFTSYSVRPGDTLGQIALDHNVTIREILELNENFENPNRIFPDQTLDVPEPWEFPVIGLYSGIFDEPRSYIIQQGETVSGIAAQRGFTLEAVLEVNPEISDPNRVTAGDVIFIPPHPANIMPDIQEDEVSGVYVVQQGDTLSQIALNHGTSVDRMLEVNEQIVDENLLFSGQVVAVPEPGEAIPVTGRGEEGYVVQTGDTLGEIALRHGVTVDEIAAANDIENPNLILAGQVLVIPESDKRSAPEIETKEGRHYIVREGDTLGEIALRHHKTITELVDANDIENPNRIVPGQVIIIPEV